MRVARVGGACVEAGVGVGEGSVPGSAAAGSDLVALWERGLLLGLERVYFVVMRV